MGEAPAPPSGSGPLEEVLIEILLLSVTVAGRDACWLEVGGPVGEVFFEVLGGLGVFVEKIDFFLFVPREIEKIRSVVAEFEKFPIAIGWGDLIPESPVESARASGVPLVSSGKRSVPSKVAGRAMRAAAVTVAV